MKIGKRILTILSISMLLLSTFAALSKNLIPKANASDGAELTGTIIDLGKDTDEDGKYNYLEVSIQINVINEGYYRVEIPSLTYSWYSHNYTYYFWHSREGYLTSGLQWLNVSFPGSAIYANKLNVTAVGEVRLCKDWSTIGIMYNIPFSHVYSYTEFDCAATLTGTIYSDGVDTDGDWLFNSLQIGVEVNVTDAATYGVYVSALFGTVWVYVYNQSRVFLDSGVQVVNVTLDGVKIYAAHGNVSTVSTISLYVYEEEYYYYTIAEVFSRPLNKTYSYAEFDPMAFFTGTILDEGVDEDDDGLYDYLKISVQVNVTDAGYYRIEFSNLVGNYSDYIYEGCGWANEYKNGMYLINFTVYGPKIYGARVNPVYVDRLLIEYQSPSWELIKLDERHMVQLPVLYNYTQFESHAFFTGRVYDSVDDTDDDGLWDYLKVGVEVNVTEAGVYQISIGGLTEKLDSESILLGFPHYFVANFCVSIHIINFTFSGPLIASCHFNPTNASSLALVEISTGYQLSYVDMAPLSRRYSWSEFDPPLNDMQLEFTVYPDATVGISGLFNFTHQFYYSYYAPTMANATIGFSTNGNLTSGSANGTIVLPDNPYFYPYYMRLHQFPLNSTTVNYSSQYNNGMLNANLDASMQLPPEGRTTYPFNSSNLSLHGAYSDGMLNINLYGNTTLPSFLANQFPLNITDATVMAEYDCDMLNGNITFHALSGFPLGDVIIHFNGNKTEISFTGYVKVLYGNWFGTEINQTILEERLSEYNSTIPGHGEDSLYNMTMGMIECTELNTIMTPFEDPLIGAKVDYNATIRGNFTQLFAYILTGLYAYPDETRSLIETAINVTLSSVNHASLTFDYYHATEKGFLDLTLTSNVTDLWGNALQLIPSKVPLEFRNQTEAFLKIANITADAVENANLDVDYSSETQQLNVHASLTANVTRMKEAIIPILPETVPAEYKDFVILCTNTAYCKLKSLNLTCNYANGKVDFDAKWLLEEGFTAELNRIKHCYMQYLNLTQPWMISWQMLMLNTTEIDLSNFKAEIRQGEIMQGEYWTTVRFEGVKLSHVKDIIDPIKFKLYRLFNLTSSSYESPREFEKLKITVIGASDTNRTVLLYAPPTMPNPDNASSDYRVMIWENTSLSSLKDLCFQVAHQETVNYHGTYHVPIFTNSTITYFIFNPDAMSITIKVNGTSGTQGFCNITIPKALVNVITGNWTIKFDNRTLSLGEFDLTENPDYVFIFLHYTHSEHTIEIVGDWVVREFPADILLPMIIISTAIAAIIAFKQRKRLDKVKATCQNAIVTFTKFINQHIT